MCTALAGRRALLDGELVVGDGGPESFYRLLGRMAVSKPVAVERARQVESVTFVAFDVVWLDGAMLVDRPYIERRGILEALHLAGENYAVTTSVAAGVLRRAARHPAIATAPTP